MKITSVDVSRRTACRTLAAGLLSASLPAAEFGSLSLGLVIHSYGRRSAADRGKSARSRIDDPYVFLSHAATFGAGSIQIGLGSREPGDAERLREEAKRLGIELEGMASLPRSESDASRFEAEIATAKRAGVTILRAVMLSGRRYEFFTSMDDFRRFAESSRRSLEIAARIVAKHQVRLAIENHKDWRAEDLIDILKRLNCEYVGVCLDTGNSVALLEEPHEVVEMLAPLAITTHFKDMAVSEYRDGFLLSEVPLGRGFIDLPRVIRALRAANPTIRFNLEMITRDPLRVPCLTDQYWTTFESLSGIRLAKALRMVREKAWKGPLPTMEGLDSGRQVEVEEANVRECFESARARFGFSDPNR